MGEMVGIWRAVTHRLDWSLARQTTNVACRHGTTGSSRGFVSTELSRLPAARMDSPPRCPRASAVPTASAGLAPLRCGRGMSPRPARGLRTRGLPALALEAGLQRLHEVHHLAAAGGGGRGRGQVLALHLLLDEGLHPLAHLV